MHISIVEPLATGHRPRYVAALAGVIPENWTATYPAWFAPPPHRQAGAPGDGGSGSGHADVVVTLDSHRLLRRPRLPYRDAAWVALDMHSRPAALHPAFRRGTWSSRAKGVADLAFHVRAGRRTHLSIVYTNPLAHAVAKAARVRHAHFVPEPVEHLPVDNLRRPAEVDGHPLAMPQRQRERPWVAVCGYLDHRKGIDLLVQAIARLASGGHEIGLVIAGEARPDFRHELQALLRGVPFPVVRLDRHLSTSELAWVLNQVDIVALPYIQHMGSSGLLGSIITSMPDTSVVVSDFGWLGRVGGQAGCITFEDGSVDGLVAALSVGIRARDSTLVRPPDSWVEPTEFAKQMLQVIKRTTTNSRVSRRRRHHRFG